MRGRKAPLWRRILCRFGLHGRVLIETNSIGAESWSCVDCEKQHLWAACFPGIGLRYRALTAAGAAALSIRPHIYERRLAAWRNSK